MRKESAWHPAKGVFLAPVPPALKKWLVDSTSLTQRLIEASSGDFRVRVIAQNWERPLRSEAKQLAIPTDQRVFVRHVHLICREQAWVYARTVIPYSVAKGRLRQLTRLGSKPLGAVLFANPKTKRGMLEVACLKSGDALFQNAFTSLQMNASPIWGRRSTFNLYNCTLLVNEFFLPPILGRN